MNLLIPGGAGYIGSHFVKYAQERSHEVVVLDNFSTGHKWAIDNCEVLEVDLLDQERLSKVLKGRRFDGVIHFAAASLVGESVLNPNYYYKNNVIGTLNLLNEMLKNNIQNIVFSSTAAIFGNPDAKKIDENHAKNPINPYGRSKLIIENILKDISYANNINAACLRYFNAAGAHESGKIGEAHSPETHLIPNILNSLISDNQRLTVYGNDYPTIDGTCIRDYVHVEDLARAHMLSLEYIKNNNGFSVFNLGNGNGFSVLDIIKSCEKVTKKQILYSFANRRIGDPPALISNNDLAMRELGWTPKFIDIDEIIKSAWKWHVFYNKF